jgi:hypothetical protein
VHHRLRALEGGGQRARVEDRSLQEPEPGLPGDAVEIREAAVGEIVDALDLVPALQQAPDEVRSDETGDAGDCDPQG